MTTTKIINKLFIHLSGYTDAPEFSIDHEGVVRIDDEIVEDPAVIVKALADNSRAWNKCVEDTQDLVVPPVRLTGNLADKVETVVTQYTGIEIRGPWPRTEAEDRALSLDDDQIDDIERGNNVVGQ